MRDGTNEAVDDERQGRSLTVQTLIHNATLILPQRLIEGGWLLIENGRILDLGEGTTCPCVADHSVNAHTQLLLPGLIDLHCDTIERLVEPRPSVHFDIRVALAEADWRLAGSGITTEFHAVSLDDGEVGVRSETFTHDLYQALQLTREETLVRHRIHARLELTSHRGYEAIKQLIEQRVCDMISLMDHSPGQGQYRTEQAFRASMQGMKSQSPEEIDALLEMKRSQAIEIPLRIERITQLARSVGIAIATHDDDTATKVQQWPKFGVTVSEFPTTLEAARQAHELGLAVCMGAPNVLRGKSSGGNLSALEAIHANVVDILSSDYYPAAMLNAVFTLSRQGVLTLPEAVRLVTLNPAQAVGLSEEYGSLEVGKLADVILVQLSSQGIPAVQQLFVEGEARVKRENLMP
jgi:alpha-D-ribose 1-methylphosphonate 5-triphosphate diphosphatase